MNKKIVVLGAGISGLATAFQLKNEGFDVTVLEKKSIAGGAMISIEKNGYILDFGPNSGLETTPVIKELVNAVGLADDMIYSSSEGNKRYILRNGKLHALPTNPSSFFSTKLFSLKAKLRLLREPFIGRSADGYYQSISEFVSRRLGQEFLDYAINPFVAGVFAGDPDKLSVQSAFPRLYALEEKYGGLIKGMIKGSKERKKNAEKSKQDAKMFSFKKGMQQFPLALANNIDDVQYNVDIKSVKKSSNGYEIVYNKDDNEETIKADIVLSATPAYVTSKIFSNFNDELKRHLEDIYYPPVMVLYLGIDKSEIKHPLDGFGFLIPSKENKSYLGSLWSSVIFNNRAPEGKAGLTIFIGGARSPQLFNEDHDELVDRVIKELSENMGITAKPELIEKKFWNHAIPQYNLGYIEHEKYFQKFEIENPGIFLSGNYRGGISVGDCIKNSENVKNRILNFASKN